MRNFTLAAGLLVASSTVAADTVYDPFFACESRQAFEEATLMNARGDTRGLDHLVRQKRCFQVDVGTEYSVVDVNADRNPRDWVKLRIYDGDSSFEVFSWLGFTY